MKSLLFLTLVGLILSDVCNAQYIQCTDDEVAALLVLTGACSAQCSQDLCTCCIDALTIGATAADYVCCEAHYELTLCAGDDIYDILDDCSGLPDIGGGPTGGNTGGNTGGASIATVAWYASALMVLVSAVANQILL